MFSFLYYFFVSLSIHSVDQSPEIVNVPVNQTAVLGSNVTFNCTATGYPKPNITWKKDNNSGSVEYKPTLTTLTGDGNNIFSKLVITEVKRKDYGVYRCVAKNSAGVKIASATLGISCYVFAVWSPVHTYPDIFESATFSFRIRLPSTRIRRIRERIQKKKKKSALQS